MRRAIKKGAWLLGTCSLLVLSLPFTGAAQTTQGTSLMPRCAVMVEASATVPAAKPVAQQVHQDSRTNATFFFSSTEDGAVRMTVKADDLDVDKTVYRDGRSRIVLRSGDDRVSVDIAAAVVDVERRDAGRMQLDVPRAAEADWLQVKVLLAGSKALRRFRALAASLDASTLKTPGGAAVGLSDAVLGHLDGDVGAVGRLQKQMRAAVQARIRPVRLAARGGEDCWHTYEGETMHAMDDYDSCVGMFRWYDPRRAACLTVWTIQAEVAWAELLSCAGLRVVGG